MAFSSVHEMIDLCKESGKPLYEVILESDLAESGLTRAESEAEMHRLWAVMRATSDGYCGADRSMSGFAGGDAAKVNAAAARGVLYADGYFADVMAEALKTAECNACMKRIVAAPTAGSCGVLPAVLLPLRRRGLADEAAVHRALYIAAGFGQVVAARATLAGAEGGCQAEVGAASGMAAAALVDIKGGTAEQCAEAFAMALTNLEGLVCDPVAGLVEIPCIKRNVIGAMNAVSAADMALAGVVGHIPADEVIDAMAEVGNAMSKDLRETGIGGEWYELLLAAFVTILAGLLLVLFLGTRMGLSIRATGDNPDMVRASSLNPSFTITVGLCLANMLTALSGAIVGQYQKTVDINSGTGIVVIGLACLIIGETLLGRRSVKKGVIAAILGSIVYRFIYAIVFYTKIVPVECLKLLTAIIVALAIAAPSIQKWATFQKRKMAARNKEGV